MKPISSQIADLQRELNNLEREYRHADDEWRAVDAAYVKLKRHREELEVQKRDLSHEIEWRSKELAVLEEAVKHERAIA